MVFVPLGQVTPQDDLFWGLPFHQEKKLARPNSLLATGLLSKRLKALLGLRINVVCGADSIYPIFVLPSFLHYLKKNDFLKRNKMPIMFEERLR